jgi:hypothetical protein
MSYGLQQISDLHFLRLLLSIARLNPVLRAAKSGLEMTAGDRIALSGWNQVIRIKDSGLRVRLKG